MKEYQKKTTEIENFFASTKDRVRAMEKLNKLNAQYSKQFTKVKSKQIAGVLGTVGLSSLILAFLSLLSISIVILAKGGLPENIFRDLGLFFKHKTTDPFELELYAAGDRIQRTGEEVIDTITTGISGGNSNGISGGNSKAPDAIIPDSIRREGERVRDRVDDALQGLRGLFRGN